MGNTVYFDLETQRSFSAVGGSKHKDKMGVSVGVLYSTAEEAYTVYGEDQMDAMVDKLLRADLVVGYNHIQFDYPVLQGYTIYDMVNQTVNLDMMLDLEAQLGFRPKLDSLAKASLGRNKTGDGLDALRWYKEYKKTGEIEPMMEIAKYCCFDVKVTKCVHEYGMEHGFIRYDDRSSGEIKEQAVTW